MKKLLIVLIALVSFSCREGSCVSTSDIAFADLKEPDLDHYNYELDSLNLSIPYAVTPNGDGMNDEFSIVTNINSSHFVSTDFKIKNGCDETVHAEHLTYPFTFSEAKDLEDGQYNFNFSIVLTDNKLLTGGGIIRVVRQ